MLKQLFTGVNFSLRAAQVFLASCLLMFFTLLRVSHVTNSVHSLKCQDVVRCSWGYMLNIRSSKTHRGTLPISLPVCKLPDRWFCPEYWISRLHDPSRRKRGGDLFACMLGRGYSYSLFRSLLDEVSVRAGLGKKFSGHSFRKGGAQYLIALGVPLTQVQERGNWKSLCVLRYLSSPIEDRVCVETALANQFR